MYGPENGNNRFAPDTYISFGVTRDYVQGELELPNYYTWVVGKTIDFALEVASPSAAADTEFKRELYAELGIGEYWMLDATGNLYGKPITSLHLVSDEYEKYEVHVEADGPLRSYSDMLKLEFWWMNDASQFDPFDLCDPLTDKSICADAVITEQEDPIRAEREARIAAERRERELLRRIERLEGRDD